MQMMEASFEDIYQFTGETLGEGSYGSVKECVNIYTGVAFAAKLIEKKPGSFSRAKVLKEIEIFHICKGHSNIIQLVEYFEDADRFYLVFEKISGGSLLKQLQEKVSFTEDEAREIIRDLAEAIKYLHLKGIAHRDIKPDNVLCTNSSIPCPVKLCDFDLCSPLNNTVSTPDLLSPVGSLEYMAPEVVETFMIDDYYDDYDDDDVSYNKKCDLWSLGIIMYILLCGYAPFSGNCGLSCGWESGETCPSCQEMLLSNIKTGQVLFPDDHWVQISTEAKDLIVNLLHKDHVIRFDADQVLNHPWIISSGTSDMTPTLNNLERQLGIAELQLLVSRSMAVNRTLIDDQDFISFSKTPGIDIPGHRKTLSHELSPSSIDECKRRRRGSKELFSKFSSIDELETDFFMKSKW